MPTNDERREVAARLRELPDIPSEMGTWEGGLMFIEPSRADEADYSQIHYVLLGCLPAELMHPCDYEELHNRLAELIEPEERTCHIEPLSLHEFFAGEKYILSSDARESAEDERFDRLSRELEEDAHFTCSSCHALFGTREVANADYDILEDGTYEVSGVAPIIKFCPYCGAKVIHDA